MSQLRELTGSSQGHWHWQCEANSEAAQQPADPEALRSQQSCLPCAATAPTQTVVSVEHASTDRPFGASGEGAAVRSHAELAMNRSLSPPSIASSTSIRSRLLFCHEHRAPVQLGRSPERQSAAAHTRSSAGDAPRSTSAGPRPSVAWRSPRIWFDSVPVERQRIRANRCRGGPHSYLGLLHPPPYRMRSTPWPARPWHPSLRPGKTSSFLESIIYRLRNTLNGNRPSWSFDPGPAQPPSGG